MNQFADTTPARTPTLLRVNLSRAEARTLCADLDAWRRQTGQALGFSGVLCGEYARLYIDVPGERVPASLIALAERHIRGQRGTATVVGAWLLSLEYGQIVGEQQLLEEVASC